METEGKRLPIAKHLTDVEYALFLKVYSLHNRSMGLEKRKDHSLSDITKVESHPEENCLHVHYKNGYWWHYTTDLTWY